MEIFPGCFRCAWGQNQDVDTLILAFVMEGLPEVQQVTLGG
jgi:hypothetical protein